MSELLFVAQYFLIDDSDRDLVVKLDNGENKWIDFLREK
jgi:hypothetical protein